MSIILIQKVTPLKCHRCNHIWNYKGKNGYVATCPHCRTYVTLKRHSVVLFGQQKQLSTVKGDIKKIE